jgi:3-oxoacyl-[acyl-carrier protein] reductase
MRRGRGLGNRLQDRVVLITGSTKGIGRATAIRCAQEGARTIVTGRDEERLHQTVGEVVRLGGKCIGCLLDVRNVRSIEQMAKRVEHELGGINVLVNNAGIMEVRSIFEMTEEKWTEVIDTNLNGVFRVTRAILPLMLGRPGYGKIINLSSQAGKGGGILPVHHYAASKAGVIAFTFSLARELAPHRVLVNCVAPGVIRTDMVLDQIEEKEKVIPLGVGGADDVANAIVFLASDEANYITGEVLDVNGGMLMD